jgi:hypothetical protein
VHVFVYFAVYEGELEMSALYWKLFKTDVPSLHKARLSNVGTPNTWHLKAPSAGFSGTNTPSATPLGREGMASLATWYIICGRFCFVEFHGQ